MPGAVTEPETTTGDPRRDGTTFMPAWPAHVAGVVLELGLVGKRDPAVALLEVVVVGIFDVAPRGQSAPALVFSAIFVVATVVCRCRCRCRMIVVPTHKIPDKTTRGCTGGVLSAGPRCLQTPEHVLRGSFAPSSSVSCPFQHPAPSLHSIFSRPWSMEEGDE